LFGFRKLVVAVLASVALVVQPLAPVYAASASVPVYEAADYLSALSSAQLLDHRILVVGELTESSTTWVNPDGSLTTDSYGSPVRVRDAGARLGWRELDFTLGFDADGFVSARSGLLPLRVSGGGSRVEVLRDGLVTATAFDGSKFGFGWDGSLPVPVLEGDTARFVDVLPGVDLLVRLDATGFEQFFEVKAKPDAQTLDRLRLLVSSRDVRVVENGSGGFDFEKSDSTLASMVSPSVYDSASGLDVAVSEPITPSVTDGVLTLGFDDKFFEREDLVYPVIVDPSVTLNASFDTYVSSAATTTDFQSSTELLVGTPDAGASRYRAFLNFPSTAWEGQDIISASLKMYLKWSWSCTPKPFTVYATSPTGSSTRWGNQPLTSGGAVTKTVAAGYNSSCAAAYVTTDVTPTATVLATTANGTAGITLRASDTDSAGWKRFNSANASAGKPTLSVTYNRYPGTPTAPSITGAQTVGAQLATSTFRPEFKSTSVDPDGDYVTLTFKSYATATSTTPSATICSVSTASNVSAGCRPTVDLVDGQTYFVRSTANDGSVDAHLLSPATIFTVYAAEPSTPTITCPYVNGYSGSNVPSAPFTCTVTVVAAPQASRTKSVTLTIDDQTPQDFVTAADGSLTKTITLTGGSVQHRLTAVASSFSGVQSVAANYVMTFGYTGVITPQKTVTSAYKVAVSSYAKTFGGAQPTTARIDWKPYGSTGAWQTAVSGLSLGFKQGVKGLYNYQFDVSNLSATGFSDKIPATLQAQICYIYLPSLDEMCTDESSILITRLPSTFDPSVTHAAGMGTVSLNSGALQVTANDFSQSIGELSLNVSRTYIANVGAPSVEGNIFGPGWAGFTGSDASNLTDFAAFTNSAASLTYLYSPSGGILSFNKNSNGTYTPWDDDTKASQVTLTAEGVNLLVTEVDGSQTVFSPSSTNSYRVSCARQGLTGRAVATEYNTSGLATKVGYTGTGTCTNLQIGSQALTLTYTTSNNQTRLAKVTYSGLDKATNSTKTVDEVSYSYDTSGRLTLVTNLVNQSTTSYSYDSLNRLTGSTVSGFAPYEYKYDSYGRLVQTLRTQQFLFVTTSTVENTFIYSAAVTGSNKLPYLPETQTKLWGQTNAPVYAAAVFDSQKAIPLGSGNTPTLDLNDDAWHLADFYFTDDSGTLTNTASYGKTKWLYTANILNGDHVAFATFSADGIEKVLARYQQEGTASFNEFDYATYLEFTETIGTNQVTPSTFVSQSWSPIRSVYLNGVLTQIRTHTTYGYDENAPDSKLYGLQTSQTIGITEGSDKPEIDTQLLGRTVTSYDPIDGSNSLGATSGWVLHQPTKVASFDSNNVFIAESKTLYNAKGQIIKTIQPGSNGTDGRTTLNTYYSANLQTVHPECGNQPYWDGLPCVTEYATTALLPNTRIAEYDWRLNATVIQEFNNTGTLRTTSNTYFDDGRIDKTTLSMPGAASITTETIYDPTSLLETGTKRYSGTVLESSTSQTFDQFGRQTSYTNSLGETTQTSYVPENQIAAGQIQTITTPKGVTNYTYGATDAQGLNEPRTLATTLTYQSSNTTPAFSYTYQAAYDELGRQTTQNAPNGISQYLAYNDANQLSSMSYGLTGTNSTWYTWTRQYNQYGQVTLETEPNSQNITDSVTLNNNYTYDPSGRLTSNTKTSSNSCNLNNYSYDTAGNRLSKTTGDCQTSTTTTHSYNSFSQLTNTGYLYDSLGRNTNIPSADAPNPANGNITLAYNINDSIDLLAQNGVSTTFTYDAENRRLNETTNSVTTTRHYTNQSDNPTFTTQTVQGVTKTEHYTPTLGLSLNIITTTDNTTKTAAIQLQDMRGNTATTIDLDTNIASSWCSFDEFGNQADTNPQNTNLINYSTYAQAQRATNNTTGLILMGARVYNPTTNQFTSPDPVTGGNENSYTYPNEPSKNSDFTGLSIFSDWAVEIGGALLTATACALTGPLGCFIASVAIGAAAGAIKEGINAGEKKKSLSEVGAAMLKGGAKGAISGAFGFGGGAALGKIAIKHAILPMVEKGTMRALRHEVIMIAPSQLTAEYGQIFVGKTRKLLKSKKR
jgi:RHS repeat-associated protein